MRKINILLMLFMSYLLMACDGNSLDSLTGKYDMNRYEFDEVVQQSTEKLTKGVKALNIALVDDQDNRLDLRIGSSEWVLQGGVYSVVESVSSDKQYVASLKSQNVVSKVKSGNLEVTLINGTYFFTGLFETESGQWVNCYFKGVITFEIGEDDPEASGYVAVLTKSPVVTYDNSGSPTVHPGVLKYTFSISDPAGNNVASFEAINAEDMPAVTLAGNYTVQGNASEPWLMANGWVFPDWGVAGGSYFTDPKGAKQYVAGGQIAITVVEGITGEMLYSFSGQELTTADAKGLPGTGSVNVKYAVLEDGAGLVLNE